MAPWLPVSEPGATLLGAANRYQIIERMVERQKLKLGGLILDDPWTADACQVNIGRKGST